MFCRVQIIFHQMEFHIMRFNLTGNLGNVLPVGR
jgi:hypothetical protein